MTNHLDRKYGEVPLSKLVFALTEIFRLYRTGVRHPLRLANNAIDLMKQLDEQQRAA